jgi:hypothetical protein
LNTRRERERQTHTAQKRQPGILLDQETAWKEKERRRGEREEGRALNGGHKK